MNPYASELQSWWLSYLRTHADKYDLYFLDDDMLDVVDETYFNFSGGGCMPWPTFCHSTQEMPDDAAVLAGHVSFANAMSHSNGSPMYFFYQQASFNIPLDINAFSATNRFVAFSCEGCIATYAYPVRPNLYAKVLQEMAAVNASPGAYLLISHGNFPTGSATQILQRLVTTGIAWLAYSEGHTIVRPDLETSSSNLAIWPEDLIYPSKPLQSMVTGPADLTVAPGVWRREFTACYQAGRFFGHCAAIVNSTPNSVLVSSSWLHQAYKHLVSLSGGDVFSSGVASIYNANFVPDSTVVPPAGALLIAQ
jgi:hypothetical protein